MFDLEPNYYVKDNTTIIATTYRVASTSIKTKFIRVHDCLYADAAAILPHDKLLFVREPFSRLVSVYSLFKKKGRISGTYEQFIDNILSGDRDWHWLPQHEWHTYMGVFVPNIIHKYGDINHLLPDLPRLNVSDPEIVDIEYRDNELNDYYSRDIELYHHGR